MSYLVDRPITRPLHDLPTWHISGRFGNYFAYVDIDRYANMATSCEALQKIEVWLCRQHPYLLQEGEWLEGPYIQEIVPELDWPEAGGDLSLPDLLL